MGAALVGSMLSSSSDGVYTICCSTGRATLGAESDFVDTDGDCCRRLGVSAFHFGVGCQTYGVLVTVGVEISVERLRKVDDISAQGLSMGLISATLGGSQVQSA